MDARLVKLAGLAFGLAAVSACSGGETGKADGSGQNAANAVTESADPMPTPATEVAVRGDPVAGKKSFGQCMACHAAEKGKESLAGPHLAGIVGKKAGTHSPEWQYSPALKASNLVWDAATLDAWIADPLKKVPGTTMHFLGVPRAPTRDNIIAYLASTGE